MSAEETSLHDIDSNSAKSPVAELDEETNHSKANEDNTTNSPTIHNPSSLDASNENSASTSIPPNDEQQDGEGSGDTERIPSNNDDNGETEEQEEQNFGVDESSGGNVMDDPLLGEQVANENNEEESNNQITNQEEGEAAVVGSSDDIREVEKDGDSNQPTTSEHDDSLVILEDENKDTTSENQKDKKDTTKIIETENGVSEVEKEKDKSDEPEVVELDDDEDTDAEQTVRIRMDGIFEENTAEGEDDNDMDKSMDISKMLQMNFEEGQASAATQSEADDGTPTRRTLPRRAAAAAAANKLRVMSTEEEEMDIDSQSSTRRSRNKEYDKEFNARGEEIDSGVKDKNKCHVCKKWTVCQIKIQQFGTNIHICTNKCMNTMRHGANNSSGRLPCAKCGIGNQGDHDDVYYWETMNFCSDLCVGNYQIEVGGKCSTCSKRVPWLSLGKYCVRFGSDVRQFCTAGCLESYKKNARVCFHCQLDIKRLGNVILANIPAKNSPKEFCSQDCVEMYVEQNLNQTVKSKAQQSHNCVMCGQYKTIYREVVVGTGHGLKSCSAPCWSRLVENRKLYKAIKCQTCTKYINMDYDFVPPTHYVSSEEQVFGFCSATCKNVFVLKNRQILSCTTCKVKKYNYDLVQYFSNRSFMYAVCSLNCLPQSIEYITSLKDTLTPPSTASEMISRSVTSSTHSLATDSFPVINSVSSVQTTDNGQTYIDATGTDYEIFEVDSSVNQIPDSDILANWDGVIRASDIQDFLNLTRFVPETKSRYIMCKPRVRTIETQTDESALTDMERIPLKTLEKILYVPVPIPCPVYIPTPTFLLETPVPFLFPLPIPVPVPIPIICNEPSSNVVTATGGGTVNSLGDQSEIEMTEASGSDNVNVSGILGINECAETHGPENVEMMDCSSSDTPVTESQSPATYSNLNTEETSIPAFVNSPAVPSPFSSTASESSPARRKLTRVEYGIRAWKTSFGATSDPLSYTTAELAIKLAEWVNKGTKPNGERYRADVFLYLCLGIQQYLRENNRTDSIFYDNTYFPFLEAITNYAESDCAQGINTRIEDIHFWESKQLGASSPGVLLFTLVYFFTKHFNLRTWEKHAALHFGQIQIVDKGNGLGMAMTVTDVPDCEGIEILERMDVMERCPIKLLKFYFSKCEHPDGPLYKAIKPDGDYRNTWYISESLDQMQIYRMFVRAMMVKADFDQS